MLTLQTVLDAPPTSPLADVDINNVAELLVQLTSEHHQLEPAESTKVSSSCKTLIHSSDINVLEDLNLLKSSQCMCSTKETVPHDFLVILKPLL